MSAKHVMISQSKALCGRQVVQGDGADCKNCARVKNIPTGITVGEINAVKADNPGMDNGGAIEAIKADILDAAMVTAQKAITDNGRVFQAEAHNWGGMAAFDALVASGWAELINDGDMSRYIRATPTPTADDIAAMADTENWFNKIVELSEQTVRAEIEESTPPAIPGYYWMRHNGHTSMENGPTVRTTDTYQLCRAGDGRVLATISHKAGFRWVPSGCWFISTLLCESWGGVPLADAFDRIKTYVRECEWAYTGDHYARMSAGDNARNGQPFTSRDDVRQGVCEAIEASGTCAPAGDHFNVESIVDTIIAYYGRVPVGQVPTAEFWLIVQRNALPAAVMAVGAIKAPIRTAMGRRARKALSRKHKPSKARVR